MNFTLFSFSLFIMNSIQTSFGLPKKNDQKVDYSNGKEFNYRNLDTKECEMECDMCRDTRKYETNSEKLKERLELLEKAEYVLLNEQESEGYLFPNKAATSCENNIKELIKQSNDLISGVIERYHLPMTTNGITNSSFCKSFLSIYDKSDAVFELNDQTEVLFVNLIFLTVNYIKEITDLLKSLDEEREIMFEFQYKSIEEIVNYLNQVFCDISILEKDLAKSNYYILLVRTFLKRMLGVNGFSKKTAKCRLTKFLISNIKNSKIFNFRNTFVLDGQNNGNVSSYLVERVIQALDLHFF